MTPHDVTQSDVVNFSSRGSIRRLNGKGTKRTQIDRDVLSLIKLGRTPHEVDNPSFRSSVHRHAWAWVITEHARGHDQLAPHPELVLLLTLENLECEGGGVQLADEIDVDGEEVGLREGARCSGGRVECRNPGIFCDTSVGEDCGGDSN